MHSLATDILVLDARLRQSLATVRSLGQAGLRVAAFEVCDNVPAFSSRWCQQKIVCPADEGTEKYLLYLEQAIEATRARVLITASDGTITLIRQYREQLERQVLIALAKEPALEIAVNKEQTLEVARRLGLGVPRGIPIRGVSEVPTALREIGLPAVVKPTESWVSGKQQRRRVISQLVTTPDEARRAVEDLTYLGGTVLFQQYLSGRRESLSLFYAKGEIYARFAQWIKRSDPPLGGTFVLRQSIAFPTDTGVQAEQLVREIELEGYSEIEFRRDDAGNPYLMEINPRLNASIELAIRSGIDFPYLLYQWVNGEHINRVKSYQVGSWMRYLAGDIAMTAVSVQQRGRPGISSPARAIFDFCISFFVPMRYDYLDWSDPLPMWTALTGWFRSLPKLVRGAFSRKDKITHG